MVARLAALIFGFAYAGGVEAASISGSSLRVRGPLGSLPSPADDARNAAMSVHRLVSTSHHTDEVDAHACSMGDQADEKACLGVQGRGCMWTRVETRDPLKRIQASNSYCLPCQLADLEVPCWTVGAWVNGKQVTHCSMSCAHQATLMQPQYACSDETGFISQPHCFDKGAKSGSKCMFIAYEDSAGEQKSSCGPCQVDGTGTWGCPAKGQQGPVDGSKVVSCLSQCDVLCAGPPACPPTVAPPPPPPPPSPGIVKVASPEDQMLSAPAPFASPTVNPYTVIQAARDAAEKAGYRVATTPPPRVYWPVVAYRNPLDYMFTTGPPPLLEEPPLPVATSASMLLKRSQTKAASHKSQRPAPLLRQSQKKAKAQ